jgi:uncharacterized protein YndB with AHSA1/START domain
MTASRKGPTISQTYFFRASRAKVFRALTDPHELARWFLKDARVPPRAGAEYEFVWQFGYRHRAKVIAFVPNRKLTLEWPAPRLGMTRVTFTLTTAKGGTRLTLRHSGYGVTPEWIRNYGGTNSGWAYFLMNLRSVLYTGTDLREAGDV